MKNFPKKILIILAVCLGVSALVSFAHDSKAADEIIDTDLGLSIEELKKKYPPSLLAAKNKTYKSGQKINIRDYSNAEIKAALLNADENFISKKSPSEIPKTKAGHVDVFLLMNNVTVRNEHELAIIDAACEFFGPVILTYSESKRYQVMQSFIFSFDKITNHIYRFVPTKITNCLNESDPFEREDRI